MIITGNIFADVPQELEGEQFRELFTGPHARIERIVSTGQASAPGFWYDQDWAEWILLVAGSAGLLLEGEARPLVLEPGSYVYIAAHRRHRVAWTDGARPTVWLAIHLR
jgi:cupin 2 domain-containing protein